MDIMVDLETMGNGNDAAIISIGAVQFDLARRHIGDSFYGVIDLESSVKAGGVIDASTVMWWMSQGDQARSALRDGLHIDDVLTAFNEWIHAGRGTDEEVCLWGNGATFDNVILDSTYKRLGLKAPWRFWNHRCYRTIKALHPDIPLERVGTHHNALDDAISQADHLIKMIGKK